MVSLLLLLRKWKFGTAAVSPQNKLGTVIRRRAEEEATGFTDLQSKPAASVDQEQINQSQRGWGCDTRVLWRSPPPPPTPHS